MRGLFLKIFLSFLLIIFLVAGVTVTLTSLRDQEFPLIAHQNFAKKAAAEYGRDAIQAYEHGGTSELDKYIGNTRKNSGIMLALFNQDGDLLASENIIKLGVNRMVHQALSSGELVLSIEESTGPKSLASSLKADSGKTYVIMLSLPGIPPASHILRDVTRGFLGWQLLMALLITVMICFALARSLTSPIGRLRHATRRFAGGDLSTRIGDQVKGKNEISGLARDFDDMAAKIEDLIAGQKKLLRDISHELRSPLARLGVALELARQQGKPESTEKALARIECEAERMNEMIGQLLGLARHTSGAVEYHFERFDLGRLLDNLVLDADFEAQKHQCRVELEVPKELYFTGSEQQLAQALENVIRNAVKYTPTGGKVRVVVEQNADQICIRVEDQGPGVPEETLDKLFDPFFRVADSRDRKSGGTGIGLAIAKHAVVLHRGEIVAKNREEGGLLVQVILPLNIDA
jgi:two-component system sensor histidine kinase CpxA